VAETIGHRETTLQIGLAPAEKGHMAPILKRLRKPSEAKSPDLATLLQPYGTPADESPAEDPTDAQTSTAQPQEGA
jgi:hypothetical protein